MRRGELHWAETSPGTQRPVLIVQADVLNDTAPTTIALPVTLTQPKAGPPLTIPLTETADKLGQPAWIRTTRPVTLSGQQVRELLGELTDAELAQVDNALTVVLGLRPRNLH